MRSELKIGIVVGVVIVVGIIIFVVKSTQDDNDQTKQMNTNQDKTQLQSQENVTQNHPDSIEPPPTSSQGAGQQEPPVEPVEVVIKEDNESGKEVIPAVKEEPMKPVIVAPEPEVKAPRYHVVKNGENLYTISEQYFGQGNQTAGTKAIQKANPDRIKDIDVIHPGWRLRIPYPEDIAP